jgi:hypothetical protein
MRRPGRRRAVAALLCALSVTAGLVLAAAPAGANNFYGDAGYRLTVKIAQISAEWRVPGILPGSGLGHARTFIYANYKPSGVDLELGTTEDEITHNGHDVASYSAFWTNDGFGPNRFHTLKAGDLVKALAARKSIGWTLTFIDYTEHWQQTIKNPGVASTTITRAGWLQEDPETTVLWPPTEQTPVLAYPDMAAVVFTHLEINNKPPLLPWADALYVEVTNGTYLLPSRQSGDAFSVSPASGAARQFMADSAAYNVAARVFSDLGEHWTGSTTAAQRYADAQPFLASAKTFVHELSTQHWPAKAAGAIGILAALENQLIALIEQLPSMSASNLSSWVQTLIHIFALTHSQGTQIHGDLGIPPTV